METKKCNSCLTIKNISEFYLIKSNPKYKDKVYHYIYPMPLCKKCFNLKYGCRYSQSKKNYMAKCRKNPEYVKKEREYYKKWYSENGRKRVVDYAEAIIDWQKKYPEKVKARCKLSYAIQKGEIKKPKECFKCDRETRLSGHHDDYNKPLVVEWLCSSCHKAKHSRLLTK